MNRERIKKAVSCIITIGLTLFLLSHLEKLLERKESAEKYTAFFEEEEDFDVLFLGTSHIKDGILPIELWHDYGIISYNLGTNLQFLPTTYWQMENVLEYTSPRLVVIDCFFLASPGKITNTAHDTFDEIPFSRTKADAVSDLLGDGETNFTYEEFLWNYCLFHSRWAELEEADFKSTGKYVKGGEYLIGIYSGEKMVEPSVENKLEVDTESVAYLEKMIEDCQKRGIEVLLIYMPVLEWADASLEVNRVYDIAEKYGVDYINFLDLDVINYQIDCFDSNHINLSGARKVTDYLGQYIMEHYDITDQRENEAFESWNVDYENYKNTMNEELRSYESLDYYMLYLLNKEYLIFVEINNPEIWGSDYFCSLFENLGVNRNSITEKTDFLVIKYAGQQVDYLENFRESESNIMTESGEMQILPLESGTYGVCLNDDEIYRITPEEDAVGDIRIVVVDKETKEIIDQSNFSITRDAEHYLYRRS